MRESSVEQRLSKGAKRLGFLSYKFVSPGNSGVPDRIVMGYGKIWFVELKTDRGILSRVQAKQIDRLRRHGMFVRVAHGPEDVDRLLAEMAEVARQEGGGALWSSSRMTTKGGRSK